MDKQAQRKRVIRAAAILDTLYGNPDVCAHNRYRKATRESIRSFWWTVFRALYRPYACQSWTDHDINNWREIRDCQAARIA